VALVRVGFTYHLALPAQPNLSAWLTRTAIQPKLGSHHTGSDEFPISVTASIHETDGIVKIDLRFETTAHCESTWDASSTLTTLARTLPNAVSLHTGAWDSWSTKDPVLLELRRQLKEYKPSASIEVPLLEADFDVVVDDVGATRVHDAAIREKYPFLSDQERRTTSVRVMLAKRSLRIDGDDTDMAVANGKAYLEASRPLRRARPIEKPRRPIWAATSTLIAAISFGMSFLALSWVSLGAFAMIVAATTIAAIYFAPRLNAERRITALGLLPIATLAAFAIAYGCVALATPTAITLAGTPLSYLHDPMLLSLSLLSTVGVLDLALHGAVRSVAYLEMLLVASAAGGAAIIAVRTFSRRAREVVDALNVERRG
jgi:hypothetical protein